MRDDRQSLDGNVDKVRHKQRNHTARRVTYPEEGRGSGEGGPWGRKHSHLVLSLWRQEPGGHAHGGDDEQADEDAPPGHNQCQQGRGARALQSLLCVCACLDGCVLTRWPFLEVWWFMTRLRYERWAYGTGGMGG